MHGNEVHSIQCGRGQTHGLAGRVQLERTRDMSKTPDPAGGADTRVSAWSHEGGQGESTLAANADPDVSTCIHSSYVIPGQLPGERMPVEAATLSVGRACITTSRHAC